MAEQTRIEWTDHTWNPLRGCTKISPGCAHCYAETFAERFRGVARHPYEQGFDLKLIPGKLAEPLRWNRPSMVFVNSMSDLFHEDVPEDFILRVFDVMGRAHWHRFQVLTKRPERLRDIDPILPWKPNIWMGVTVENRHFVHRIDLLRETGARVKFLSLEPLLGPLVDLRLDGIDWAIVGGESGPKARPIQESWVLDIRDQCRAAGVAFFFKQWGGVQKSKTGRLLEGRTWDEMPATATAANGVQSALPLVG